MPTQPRNIAEAALQLQTAAAELHALSVLPEAGRDESIHEAIEDIGERVEQVEDSLKQLRNDFRSLRDKMDKRMKSVEAQVYNDRMLQQNRQFNIGSALIEALRDHETNKIIVGFPDKARDFRALNDSDCIRIAKALGWTLIANDSLYVKQNFVLGLAGLSTSAVDSHW